MLIRRSAKQARLISPTSKRKRLPSFRFKVGRNEGSRCLQLVGMGYWTKNGYSSTPSFRSPNSWLRHL